MASATGIPEQDPARREEEPLLGRPGDATQLPEQGLQFNFITGTGRTSMDGVPTTVLTQNTAILAQAGAWILAALVWVCSQLCNIVGYLSNTARPPSSRMTSSSSPPTQCVNPVPSSRLSSSTSTDRLGSFYNLPASFFSSKQSSWSSPPLRRNRKEMGHTYIQR